MTDVLNWKDSYDNTASRIVLTSRELQIPGLRSFGWQRDVSASWPLPNHFHENLLELTFIAEGNYTFRIGGADYPLKGGELFIAYPNEIHSTNQLAPKGRRLSSKTASLWRPPCSLSKPERNLRAACKSLFLRPGGRGSEPLSLRFFSCDDPEPGKPETPG